MNNKENTNKYLLSNIISIIGTQLFVYMSNFMLVEQTDSIDILSKATAISMVPIFITTLYSGNIAARYNKKASLIILDVISAALSIVIFLNITEENTILMLVVIFISIKVISSMYSIINKSIMNEIFEIDQIKKNNASLLMAKQFLLVLTPFLGSIIISKGNFKIILLINGFSYLVTALLTSRYTIISAPKSNYRSVSYLQVLSKIKAKRDQLFMLITVSVANFWVAGMTVILPYMYITIFKYETGYAISSSILALGSILGAYSVRKRNKESSYFKIMIFVSGLFILTFPNLILYFPMSFIFGFLIAKFNISFISDIQIKYEGEAGKVIALYTAIGMAATPLGVLFVNYVLPTFGKFTLNLLGIGLLTTLAVTKLYFRNPKDIANV